MRSAYARESSLSALEHSGGGAISLSLYLVSICFPDWDLIEYRDVIVSDGPLLVLTMQNTLATLIRPYVGVHAVEVRASRLYAQRAYVSSRTV